jgi:hypothetical protein
VVTDAQIQTALQGFIANQIVPATTSNTLYFIFLPPNVVSTLGGSSSCVAGGFCGYHNRIGNVYYAVIPFVNCAGCVFGGAFLDTLTEVASHELAEAITDPELNAWWDSSTGEEVGDICNRQTTRLGGFLVQTEWSNEQQACAFAPQVLPLQWSLVSQSGGFGNLIDGQHPIWIADFTRAGHAQVMFYYRGDGNWWLGDMVGGQLQWSLVSQSGGFGNLIDGQHPIWIADFTGSGHAQVMFYYSGDGNWWLGTL